MNRIITEAIEAFNEVLRISDRDHDAWVRARNAMNKLEDLATLQPPSGQVGEVSDGAEFFPLVDDLTEMIDHWKENTDMDTHDLIEGIIGYFGIGRVRMGRDAAIDELVATLDAWDGAWRSKVSTKLFDSLVAMLQRLPDLPDNGSPFELHDRGSKFLCRVCGTEYWAHLPATCPRCNSLKRQVEALRQPVETVNEWDALTKEEMWEEIQAIRNMTDNDGTMSPLQSVARVVEELEALRTQPQAPVVEVPSVDNKWISRARELLSDINLETHYLKDWMYDEIQTLLQSKRGR